MANDVLILAEQAGGKIKKFSFELAGVARTIAEKTGGAVHALLVGKGVTAAAGELGKYGVKKVHVVDSPEQEAYNPESVVAALAAAAKVVSPKVVLGTASSAGKDALPRVAARLGAGYANDCVDLKLEGKLVVKRPLYAGKCYALFTFQGDLAVATVRPNS